MTDTITQLLTPQTFKDGEGPLDASSAIMAMVGYGSEPDTQEEPTFVITMPEGNGSEPEIEVAEEADSGEEETAPAQTEESDSEEEAEEQDPYHWGEDVPKLKAKRGELEFDIPEDAIVAIKIGGKFEDVPIADLKRDYQGRIPWNDKFHELKQKERGIAARETQVQNHLQETAGKIRGALTTAKSDVIEGLVDICLTAGVPSNDVEKIIDSVFQQVLETHKLLNNTPAERIPSLIKGRVLAMREKALKHSESKMQESQAQSAENQRLTHYIQTKQREKGISDPEMEEAVEVVLSTDAIDVSSKTKNELADLAFQYVIDFARPYTQIKAATKEVAPELLSNPKFLDAVYQATHGHSLSDDQLKNTIKKYIRGLATGSSNGHAANDKRETPKAATTKPQAHTSKKPAKKADTNADEQSIDPVSIDEIRAAFGVA